MDECQKVSCWPKRSIMPASASTWNEYRGKTESEKIWKALAIALIAYLFIIATKISIRIYVSVYHVEALGEICLGNIETNMCLQRYSRKPQKVGL